MRVPGILKFAYGAGAAAETIIGVAFNAFNFFFYTNIMGVPGTLAGLAITIALFFDAGPKLNFAGFGSVGRPKHNRKR